MDVTVRCAAMHEFNDLSTICCLLFSIGKTRTTIEERLKHARLRHERLFRVVLGKRWVAFLEAARTAQVDTLVYERMQQGDYTLSLLGRASVHELMHSVVFPPELLDEELCIFQQVQIKRAVADRLS